MRALAGFMVGAIASYLLIRRRQRQAAAREIHDALMNRFETALDAIETALRNERDRILSEPGEVTMEERQTGRLSS